MNYKHVVRYYVPLVLYLIFIFYLSSLSLPHQENFKLGKKINFIDNYEHIIEYGLLSFLFYRAIKHSNLKLKRSPFFYAILFSLIYALTDEIHQIFVPLRGFDKYDLLADTLGSSCILVFKWIKNKAPGLSRNE